VCILWLKYELVLQHVHHSNAAKTPWSIVETAYGAEKQTRHVLLQTARILFASKDACFLAESVEKPLKEKLWKETLKKSQMIRSSFVGKRCEKSGNGISSKCF
jgi:hypothetical protein